MGSVTLALAWDKIGSGLLACVRRRAWKEEWGGAGSGWDGLWGRLGEERGGGGVGRPTFSIQRLTPGGTVWVSQEKRRTVPVLFHQFYLHKFVCFSQVFGPWFTRTNTLVKARPFETHAPHEMQFQMEPASQESFELSLH